MSHTYISDLVHCVFSTKQRRDLITDDIRSELWAFLGGIARINGFKALIVGGTENHVHILLSLSATMPLAKAVQLIKGASSRWMNEEHTSDFACRRDMVRSRSESRRRIIRSHTSDPKPSIIASGVSRKSSWHF